MRKFLKWSLIIFVALAVIGAIGRVLDPEGSILPANLDIGHAYSVTGKAGGRYLSVWTSEKALNALEDAASKNDTIGEDEILTVSPPIQIESGTNVLVLDADAWHEWHKVRVLHGTHYGEVVVIPDKTVTYSQTSSE